MNIKIYNGQDYLPDNFFFFPAGEIGIKLNADNHRFFESEKYTICAQVQNSNDLFRIAFAKDAIERIVGYDVSINLFCPYLPYARQDRLCDKGESFSLKVICDYINHLNFDKVTIVDPHSLVSEALIERVNVISQFDIFHRWQELKRRTAGLTFVAPDAGSNKKTSELAAYFGHEDFIRGDKLRDLTNGKIKEIKVYCDDLKGRGVVISDDLCDAGGTFLGLAKALKEKNCGNIVLYVTHGIFSHKDGVNHLLKNGIDEIWTTNSYQDQPMGFYPQDKVNILKLEDLFQI